MPEMDAEAIAQQARARGAFAHIVRGAGETSKASTMESIAAAFSFPDWFGHNLDALYDCLTDLAWLPTGEHVLIWVASDALKAADPKGYLAIHSVLSDAQRALGPGGDRRDDRTLTVVLADS